MKMATSKQLAEIQAIQANLRKLNKQRHRPLSMAICLALIPPAVRTLLLYEGSPLHQQFYDWHYNTIAHDPEKGYGAFDIYKDEHLPIVAEIYDQFITAINEFGKEPLFRLVFGENLPPKQLLGLLENYYVKNPNNDPTAGELKEPLNQLKKMLIHMNNLMDPYDKTLHNRKVDELFKEDQPELYSATTLFETVDKKYTDHIKSFPNLINAVQPIAAKLTTDKVINFKVIPFEVIATMLAQYFIVDPLLDRFFPHGVWQKKPSEINFSYNLTDSQARQLSKDLEKRVRELNKTAHRNVLISRYSSFAMLFLAFILYNNEEPLSPYMFVLALTACATAMENLGKDFSDYIHDKLFYRRIEAQENYLRKIVKKFGTTIARFDGEDIESSYFTLHFDGKDFNDVSLSGKKLATLFKDCCLHYGLTITSKRGNILSFPAQSALNKKNAAAIKKLFNANVEREIQIKRFLNQLWQLIPSNEKYLVTPQYDHEYLSTIGIEIRLPITTATHYLNKLKELFADHHYSQQEDGNELVINISGCQPLDASKLADIKNPQYSPWEHKRATHIPQLESEEESKAIAKRKTTAAEEKADKQEETSTTLSPVARIVRWQAGIYNSNSTNNTIQPIPFGTQHTQESYAKARFFVTNGLDPNKIPQEIRDYIMNLANKSVKRPHFARSKKGEEGWLFWKSPARDQNGCYFPPTAKVKFLGEGGDIRLYAEAQKSDTGETLLEIKGYELASH